ncbi:MAG TPA: DUF3516 domain-containing protein, partial [Dongiaceae bacterium]|nr:DUF3516 domain-containing protein [Dongiaceae bacterium]
FADHHPWVGEENIRPKSIAREMFVGFRSFADYVQEYDLERAEGLLLRHLDGVYKALAQTVPDDAKTELVVEMEFYLRDLLRGVDSSLLDAWQAMLEGGADAGLLVGGRARAASPEAPGAAPDEPPDITRDAKSFTAAIRARLFAFLRAWSIGRDNAALEAIAASAPPDAAAGDAGWSPDRLAAARDDFKREHGDLRLDPEARNLRHTRVTPSEDGARWVVQQTLVDPDGFNDWIVEIGVDLAGSRTSGQPMLRLLRLGTLA